MVNSQSHRAKMSPSPRNALGYASPLKGEESEVDALACGAYDARLYRCRSKTIAQSPAIDRGTDDAYGYDSTSTNLKVIDMGQPDLGYHYYRRVADDDPPTNNPNRKIEVSFHQPDLSKVSDLNSLRYRLTIPPSVIGGNPTIIKDFEWINYQDESVITGAIVQGLEEKLKNEKRYDLESYSQIGTSGKPPDGTIKVGFIVIVDSIKPSVTVAQ